jgi:hypothetical protein
MPKLVLILAVALPLAASLAAIGSLSQTRNEYFEAVHAYPAAPGRPDDTSDPDAAISRPQKPLQVADHRC